MPRKAEQMPAEAYPVKMPLCKPDWDDGARHQTAALPFLSCLLYLPSFPD